VLFRDRDRQWQGKQMEATASERQPREGRQVSFLAKNKTKESDKKDILLPMDLTKNTVMSFLTNFLNSDGVIETRTVRQSTQKLI